MKKIFATLTILLFILVSCTVPTQNPAEIITEQTTTTEYFTWPDLDWPERDSYLEHGGRVSECGNYSGGRFRPRFYQLTAHFSELVGREVSLIWQRSRSNEQYHNEAVVISFVREFNISREDFERANEEFARWIESTNRTPNTSAQSEIYNVDLIFSFDNERINEFFRWENSIFAHEVGLPNPLRGDWDEDGVWHDHPNWTENPGWRDHPFWEYLPFFSE